MPCESAVDCAIINPSAYIIVAITAILDQRIKHNGLTPPTQTIAVVNVRRDADPHNPAVKSILEAGSVCISKLGDGGCTCWCARGTGGCKHTVVAKVPVSM